MITVAEYNDLAAVAGIRELWRSLWWKTRRASFFQSVEWFEGCWPHVAGDPRLRVLVVSVAGRPLGIVPLAVKTARSRLGCLRVLTDPFDARRIFYGPLGPSPAVTLEAALTHVMETPRDWDLIELRHPGNGLDLGGTPRALESRRFQTHAWIEDCPAIVECREHWVGYCGSRPEQLRDDYRRCERTLSEWGDVEYVRYRPEGAALGDDHPRWDLFNEFDLRQVEDRGDAQRCLQRSTTETDRCQFLRQMHKTAAGIAAVDFNILRLDGRPIAWAYNYRCDGRIEMQSVRAAAEFEPEARTVLLGRMFHDGFRRRDECYVLDPDTSRAAQGWETGRASTGRSIYFSPRAPRVQMLRLVRWLRKPLPRVEPSTSAAIAG